MFGSGKKDQIDVRVLLGEVAMDLGGSMLSLGCLKFFDDRKAYETWDAHSASEPLWVSDGYTPDDAEVAADILREMLIADKRAVVIDWAAPAASVIEEFDNLLERAGVERLDLLKRRALIAAHETCKRGDAVVQLMGPLDAEAAARGMSVHWWDTQGDAHMPLVARAEVLARWKRARFGPAYAVLR